MVTLYRQLKEAVGVSKSDSDAGKLVRLKDELKSTLADRIQQAPPLGRPLLREMHAKALEHVAAKNHAAAAKAVDELKQHLDGRKPQPGPTEVDQVRSTHALGHIKKGDWHAAFAAVDDLKPGNLEEWNVKIARGLAFIREYSDQQREVRLVRDVILPYATRQRDLEAAMAKEQKLNVSRRQTEDEALAKAELERLRNVSIDTALDALHALKPTTLDGWSRKIAGCEAFLERFKNSGDSRKLEIVELALLPDALKRRSQLEAEQIYLQGLNDEGDHPLQPSGEFQLTKEKLSELMAATSLNEAEILAIRVFTSVEYKKINPVVANQGDKQAFSKGQTVKKGQEPKVPWLDAHIRDKNMSEEKAKAYRDQIMDSSAANGGMLMKALRKLPPKAGTIYRGQRMNASEFAAMLKKGGVDLETFQSQSMSLQKARTFAYGPEFAAPGQTICVVTEAQVRSGRGIAALSMIPDEEELVMLPGTRLVLQGRPVEETEDVYQGLFRYGVVPPLKFFYVKLKESEMG